jgi:hypothetical protein
MPTRKTSPSPLASPPNEKPSSAINVNEVLQLAAEVDRATEAEPEEQPKKKRGGGRKKDRPAEPEAEMVIENPPPDPEFIAMCNWGVGAGVDAVKEQFDWTEPGIHWRVKVAECFARIIDRLRPMQPGPLTDLFTAGGYVGLWVVSNVSANRTAKSKDSIRDNGKRENLQNEGPVTT